MTEKFQNSASFLLIVEVHESIEFHDCQIVVEVSIEEFIVNRHRNDTLLDVLEEFRFPIHVPFAETDAQLWSLIPIRYQNRVLSEMIPKLFLRCHLPFKAVSGSQDVTGSDQSAAAHVDAAGALFTQDGHVPWKLAEFSVAIDMDGGLDASRDAQWIAASAGRC